MATFVGLHNRVYLGHLDLSGQARQVDFGTLTAAMADVTTFNDGGYTCVLPGLRSGSFSVTANQDFAADVLDDELGVAALGAQYAVTVVPNPSGTVAAGDACWLSRGVIGSYNPVDGAVGAVASAMLTMPYDTGTIRGVVGHPLAARTTTGNGTAIALTGPTTSQKLWAALHVTAYSGLTNVVVKVQSDDGSGFASATDRITFATVTGKTSEFATLAGYGATETHHRATWTVSGTGSISFVVAFGVL